MEMRFFFRLPETNLLVANSPLYQFEGLSEMWLLIVPLAILQLGLMAFAVVDWARHPRTRYLDRRVWLLIIVVFGFLGPVAYFFLGREEE